MLSKDDQMSDADRIKELETAVRRAWRLVGGDGQEPNTVLGLLPAGGIECERFAEIARDTLGAVIGEESGLRGMRTAGNEPAPRDELDEIAQQVMGP
jgi:hypothetical protein